VDAMKPTKSTGAYQPPLRGAVLFAVGLDRGAVSVETLAELAQVAVDRASAFASILVKRGAIAETPRGYVQGPAWVEWSQRPTRSRPARTSDRLTIAEMDAMRQSMRTRVRAALEARGWSARDLARRSGVYHQYVIDLTLYANPPPACHLIALARALDLTVEELAAPLQPGEGARPGPQPAYRTPLPA
jgi:lambda repressor-like predicted transcriptional regulator